MFGRYQLSYALFHVFFFKQKTAYEMRISDWSSDVCSSDLLLVSHDRGLLNRAVNRIIHVENRKLTAYTGNYDRFEQPRREHLERQAALHRSEEHTSELQSLMRISYAVFCLKKTKHNNTNSSTLVHTTD